MAVKTKQEFIYEGMSPEEVDAFEADAAGTQIEPQPDADQAQAGADNQAQQSAEGQGQTNQQQDQQKTVDLRALQEARASERAAREELARFRTEQAAEKARLEERISLINQAIEAQNKPAPKVPSKDEDPLAFYDHQIDSVNGKFQTLEQKLEAMEKAEQERAKHQAFEAQRSAIIDDAQSVISAAMQSNPELQGAMNHALDGIRSEIAAMLDQHQVPPAQRQAVADQWWRNSMVSLAQRCPRDPQQAANFVMQNARYYGYGYQQQQAAAQALGQAQQPGQTMQQPAAQQKTVQDRAEQQQRHMSLSGTQGGQPLAALDAKALASMSDKDFNALMRTVEGRKKVDSVLAGD